MDGFDRTDPVGRIVIALELAQQHVGAVVELDVLHRTGFVVDLDVSGVADEVRRMEKQIVLLHVSVTLGGSLVVVERHARAHDVQHGRAAVRECRLEQRNQLLPVTGKRARDERRAEFDGDAADVDGSVLVRTSGLRGRTDVGGGGKLPLGQSVAAVVLDDVRAINVPADQVTVLPQADAGRVAVAADAEHEKLSIGELRPRRRRRHAPVQAVETVSLLDEVGRRLGRTPDAAHLGQQMRLHAVIEQRLNEMIRDRVVAAARAERGREPLVHVARESYEVDVRDGHGFLAYSATTAGSRSALRMGSTMALASIGTPS